MLPLFDAACHFLPIRLRHDAAAFSDDAQLSFLIAVAPPPPPRRHADDTLAGDAMRHAATPLRCLPMPPRLPPRHIFFADLPSLPTLAMLLCGNMARCCHALTPYATPAYYIVTLSPLFAATIR